MTMDTPTTGNVRQRTLLAAVCDFGWGSLGKFRLILDHLPVMDVVLYGDAGINAIASELLGSRHHFTQGAAADCDAALVINDPHAANQIADIGVPVVYVDSLPYLWAKADEVPAPDKLAYYCAQAFPRDRLPLSSPLTDRQDIQWIEPIVPPASVLKGGGGVVISVGGLHSHLAGDDAAEAYLRLVLLPLVEALTASGWPILAVCGNLPAEICRQLGDRLPKCRSIGRQSPYTFEGLLQGAGLLITSPGSTTILQAITLNLPTLLLPPQNLSQMLNARLFSLPQAPLMAWPASVMDMDRIEQLRPAGEDAVLAYIYRAISEAAASERLASEVAASIRAQVCAMPEAGVLDSALALSLGTRGGAQVAHIIERIMAGHRSESFLTGNA